jgi:diguanylate cyclase (GGDEF)-like protein
MKFKPLIELNRILVIEYQLDNLRFLEKLLGENGYQVESGSDGKKALEMVTQKKPNLILLDANLSELEGEQFCQELITFCQTAMIPILWLTYLDRTSDRLKAFDLGAVDYIGKPYQATEVLRKVKTQFKILELEEKLKTLNQELEKHLPIDPLTGLSNRHRFDEYLSQEWRRGARERIALGDISQTSISLILCQIDDFQSYQQRADQETVNQSLKNLAQAIRFVVKRPADFVARYGSHKFAILLPNTDVDGAIQVASYIKQKAQILCHDLTLSMGIINRIPTQALAPESLIIAAQNLIYEAQEAGGDCIIADND